MTKEHDKALQSCPCKDCVSYAMCRAEIRESATKEGTGEASVLITEIYFNRHLLTKCSIFNRYADIHLGIVYDSRYRMIFDVLRRFYGVSYVYKL